MSDENVTTAGGANDKSLDGLKKDLTEQKKVSAETNKRLEALEKKNLEQEKTIGQQKRSIDALTGQLERATDPEKARKAEKPKIPEKTFKVNDQEFKFLLAEFVYNDHRITAIDALADKEILADLVRKKSGVIQEVH